MANTTNLNLVKPAGTDYALVSVINGNMDIIDSKVGAIPANESAQSQITALNNQIGKIIAPTATNDILVSALSATSTTLFRGAGSSYTGDVPENNFKWGAFYVFVVDGLRYVWAQSSSNTYATIFYNGSAWSDWKVLAPKSDLINAVNLSTNLTIDYADAGTIGYRTTETTKVDIQNLQGFPTGKTIICAYPRGYDDIYGANLWVDNSLRLRGTSKTARTISVTITVFYK